MITIALKSQKDFSLNPFGLPNPVRFENLTEVWSRMAIPRVTFNSVLITVASLFLIVLCASLAAYAIARRKNKLYGTIYLVFLAGSMVPFHLIMIPLYKVVKGLGLMGRMPGVALIYTALAIPFAMLIITEFTRNLPEELDESAKIDGCGKLQIFLRIILPLLKAPLVTVIVFNSVWIWNDLIIPLLFLGGKRFTIVTALYNFKGFQYTTDWTMVFAGSVITMMPLVLIFLLLQKYFIKGMISGAIKG
jgi:raffinose/stachyose/melibiose transport system permease protein